MRKTLLAISIILFSAGAANAGLSLSLEGGCPGGIIARVSGATPNRPVAFIYGRCGGTTRIPDGACAGTVLDVGHARAFRFVIADINGDANLIGDASKGACNTICIQAVDATTCSVTNTVGL